MRALVLLVLYTTLGFLNAGRDDKETDSFHRIFFHFEGEFIFFRTEGGFNETDEFRFLYNDKPLVEMRAKVQDLGSSLDWIPQKWTGPGRDPDYVVVRARKQKARFALLKH